MSTASIHELEQYYLRILRPLFAGRQFMYVTEIDVVAARANEQMSTLGVDDMMFLVGNKGTSGEPIPAHLKIHSLNTTGINMVESAQNFEQVLMDLSTELYSKIEEWDPGKKASWVTPVMLRELDLIAGRKKYGRRLPSWLSVENKTTIDAFWRSIGITSPPSTVVELTNPSVDSIAQSLDQGAGTVWSADNRDGIHGGTIGVRWVKSEKDVSSVRTELQEMANTVRIASFVEGIPMSIHGIVFSDTAIVFRPIELITLRYRDSSEFLWGGCSSNYDPPQRDREYMRELAALTGRELSKRVGYRGPFSIDGIMSKSGFVPTELNCRLSAGFNTLTFGLAGFPLAPLCWAIMEDVPLNYEARRLETALLHYADSNRVRGGRVITTTKFDRTKHISLVREGLEYREACDNDTATAAITYGPSPMGGIVFVKISENDERKNEPVANEVVRAIRFADERLGTHFGQLDCATIERE